MLLFYARCMVMWCKTSEMLKYVWRLIYILFMFYVFHCVFKCCIFFTDGIDILLVYIRFTELLYNPLFNVSNIYAGVRCSIILLSDLYHSDNVDFTCTKQFNWPKVTIQEIKN